MQNQYLKRLKLQIPLTRMLTVEKASEILQKSFQMVHLGFDLTVLDKPVDGTILIFNPQFNNQPLEDGYGWMDNEQHARFTLENGLEIQVFTRQFGFSNGDLQTTIVRKRFKLSKNSELELLFYSKQFEIKQNVNLQLAKTLPKSFNRKQQQQPVQQVPMVMVELEEDIDKKYGRVLALERFKRNHSYMQEIFGQLGATAISNASRGGISSGPGSNAKDALGKDAKDVENIQELHVY